MRPRISSNTNRLPMPHRTSPTKPLGVLALSLSLALPALAQTAGSIPNAGQTLRDLQRTPPPAEQPAPTLTLPAEVDRKPDDTTRFVVREVRLQGNRRVTTPELEALVADLVGPAVSLADVRQGTRRITAVYRARGYLLARAYVPAQEMKDGLLRIE